MYTILQLSRDCHRFTAEVNNIFRKLYEKTRFENGF